MAPLLPLPHVHLRKEFTPCFPNNMRTITIVLGYLEQKPHEKKTFIKFSLFHFKSFAYNLTLFGTVFKLRNKKKLNRNNSFIFIKISTFNFSKPCLIEAKQKCIACFQAKNCLTIFKQKIMAVTFSNNIF